MYVKGGKERQWWWPTEGIDGGAHTGIGYGTVVEKEGGRIEINVDRGKSWSAFEVKDYPSLEFGESCSYGSSDEREWVEAIRSAAELWIHVV